MFTGMHINNKKTMTRRNIYTAENPGPKKKPEKRKMNIKEEATVKDGSNKI